MINREAWAVGTLARLFKLGAPPGWDVEIRSYRDIDHRPEALRSAISSSDLVHWSTHKPFRHYLHEQDSRDGACHVVTVHHFEGDEDDLDYLLRAKGIVVHADKYLDECRMRLNDQIPVMIIPYPVDTCFFDSGESRLSTGLAERPDGPFRIGFFSSAQYETGRKGVDLLPAIASELTERIGDWEMIVTGLGWDTVLSRPEFCSLPIRHVLLPSYFDMPRAYSSLDAYLCLSRVEGGPMTVFEAVACGIPVVSTEVGRVPDVLEPDAMYRSVPFDSPGEVVEELVRLAQRPANVSDMCERALVKVRSTMSAPAYQESLLRFYESAMGKQQGPCAVVSVDPRRGCRMRRRWRAWDRTYWAKELLAAGHRRQAIGMLLDAFRIDPFCEGIWRIPARKLGFRRDEK